MTWLEHLIDLVCRLLKVVDGDCDQLEDQAAEAIIDEIDRRYDPDDPPEPESNEQKAEWCALFSAVEDHLDLPGNILSAPSDATLRSVIGSLRGDIGC